jgi:U3 small nucleolar RNA-associated protein 10
LCRIDPRFQSYRKTLFSQSTQTLDRDQQTAEINAKLDASIGGFCHLLSSYFLLPAAFKTLEYLIRRFKVNEMNIPALMHAALPYHATNEFVRLVQTLRLDNNNALLFTFLTPMQKSGVALPRELLVQRCLTDRGLLRFVCDAGQELGSARVAARTAMPFVAALLCEVVAAAPAVDESLMAMLLPYIIHGLSADISPDYRAAIYMVLVQLATRATFTSDLISAIVLELCKSVTPAGLPQVLLVLCHLAFTQPELSVFPENAFKYLAKLPALAGELEILVNKGASRSQNLLALLSTAAARHVISHDNYARLMDELLTTVSLGGALIPAAETLLAMSANTGIIGDQRKAVIKALRSMDLRHPEVTEKAVNAALQKFKDTTTAAEKREHLSSALQEAFTGSLRAPMLEAGTTLALAVDAASAGIRRLALEKLDAIASGSNTAAVGDNNEDDDSARRVDAEQVLRGALLRRLFDEHPAVVQTVLGMNTLLTLPPAALLEALSSCLATALLGAAKKGASKGDRAASRGIARKIIKLLAGEFIVQNPEDVDRAAELLLTAVLSVPHTRKVAETAVRRGGKVENHPLLQGLKDADIDSAQAKAATIEAAGSKSTTKKGKPKSTRKKEKTTGAAGESSSAKGYDDTLHNTIVIQALATKAAESTDAQRALAVLLGSTESRTKALALAVANIVLHLDGGALLAEAVLQRFSASSEVHNGLAESNDAAAVFFDEKTGLADDATLLALANGTLHPRQVQPAVVLTALRVLPSTSLKTLGLEGLTRLFRRLCALPSASWGQHLEVLVARASEIVESVQLLTDLWGAPAAGGDNNTKVHVSALQLWTHAIVSGSILPALSNAASPTSKAAAATGRGKTQARAAVFAALPRLLRLLGHTEAAIRNAGVEACAILAAKIDVWWGATSTTETAKSGALDRDTTATVLNSIVAQAGAIKSDSEAAESLLRNSLENEESGAAASPGKSRRSPRGGNKKKTSTPAFAGVRLALDSSQATNLKDYLLKELPKQHGPAGLETIPFIIQVVHDSADPVALLLAAKDLLGTFALQEAPHLMLRPLRNSLDRSVAALLVELYNDVAMTALLRENGSVDANEGNAKDIIDSLLAMLRLPGAEGSTDVRRVALAAVTPATFAVLPEEAQRDAFVALVAASTQDSDQGCRDAAHASLASLPLTADILIPLLIVESNEDVSTPGNNSGKMTVAARRKQRRTSHEPSSPAAGATPTNAGSLGAGFPSFLAILEVLQWKDDIENAISLVPQLQNALNNLLGSLARHAAATKEQNNGDDGEGQQGEQSGIVLDDDGDSRGMQAAQAYAMQLILALLHTLARHHVHPAAVSAGLLEPTATANAAAASKGKKKTRDSTTSDTPFDISIAVRCAQDAPDVAVRSAALSLVGTLATAMPQAALGHVLTVVSVVGDASSELIDAHSSAVAAQCLGAVVTAWISSGGDAQELVHAVIGCAAAAPAPRRLPLLGALVAGLPEVSGMCMVLLGLLNRHLVDKAAVEDAKKKKKKKQHAKDVEEDEEEEEEDTRWSLVAAKALLQKVRYFVSYVYSSIVIVVVVVVVVYIRVRVPFVVDDDSNIYICTSV